MTETDIRIEFVRLRAKGLSFDKIAKELKKSKQTLINWSKEHQEEIANLRAIEIEALQEELSLSLEARLQAQGIVYKKLREEAEGRDFSEVPTAKLLDLLFKYDKRLQDELIEPQFTSKEEAEVSKLERAGELKKAKLYANIGAGF